MILDLPARKKSDTVHLTTDNPGTIISAQIRTCLKKIVMSDTLNDTSLAAFMQEISDPRVPYNQRHKYLDIIIIAATAALSGMDIWNEIEYGAHFKKEWLASCLELPWGIPCHDMVNRVFQMLSLEKFHRAFFH